MGERLPPRVAYISSPALRDAADRLPSNIGRSSLVHYLIDSLDLLEVSQALDDEEGEMQLRPVRESSARAVVIEPEQATRKELLTFHDGQFVRQSIS